MKMTKMVILAVLGTLIVTSVPTFAEDLEGSVEARYLSRFIWRGFDIYSNNHSGLQTEIDLDLYGTGFGFNTWYSRAVGEDFENQQWMPFTFYYKDDIGAMDYKVGWTYYSHPDEPRKAADMQEIFGKFSLPMSNGLTPHYTVAALWPSEGKSTVKNNGGWVHIFGMDYNWKPEGFTQDVKLSAEIVYNDGFAPGSAGKSGLVNGKTVDHDWSHAVFGIATDYKLQNNLVFTPGLYYQASMDDSVNSSDEYWVSLGMKYLF